jgi:3-methyl-2-oxobutanoate hydroxymethyltransferase
MLTAYDYPTALACSSSSLIDIVLVGDSLAHVCLGLPSTTCLTMDMMVHHCAAVTRGTNAPLLISDMPYGSFQVSDEETVRNAVRLVREGGVEGVKLEGGSEVASRIHVLTSMGIPVLGHVGLLPQRQASLSGYRVQGKNAEDAISMLRGATALEEAGAFGVVLEGVPWKLASYITSKLTIPTIGIGAGPNTSGQVLVKFLHISLRHCHIVDLHRA